MELKEDGDLCIDYDPLIAFASIIQASGNQASVNSNARLVQSKGTHAGNDVKQANLKKPLVPGYPRVAEPWPESRR